MPQPGNYPATVAEVLDDSMGFRPATFAALEAFRASRPWRGPLPIRQEKVRVLHAGLCGVYGKRTVLAFENQEGVASGESCYRPSADAIILRGRLSVVTYLHEFAHALGRGERGACRWSLNLFRKVFPASFARLRCDGHTVRTGGERS
jgi:hypothetical protein